MNRYVLDRPARRGRRRGPLVRCQIRERGKELSPVRGQHAAHIDHRQVVEPHPASATLEILPIEL